MTTQHQQDDQSKQTSTHPEHDNESQTTQTAIAQSSSTASSSTRQTVKYADSSMSGKAFSRMIWIFGIYTVLFCIGVILVASYGS